ncbi:ATP-binding protein [Methylobacterium sp. M6A4_1b]
MSGCLPWLGSFARRRRALLRRGRAWTGELDRSEPDALRAAFEASPDRQFVFARLPDGGFRLAAWNAAAAHAVGRGGEAIGCELAALLPTEQAAPLRAGLERAIATGRVLRIRDQTTLPDTGIATEAIYVPLHEPDSRPIRHVHVSLRDIHPPNLADAEAREANRLLIMAEQVAHVGHWHLHIPSRLLRWSDEVYRIHGLDPRTFEPTIQDSIAACHPDDRLAVLRRIAGAIRRGADFDLSLRLVRPSGEVREVQVRSVYQREPGHSGRFALRGSIFGVFADVTELKSAERALAEKSALLEATLESMDQGLLMIDGRGRIPVINRRAIEILAVSPELIARAPDYRALRRLLRETGTWGTAIEAPSLWRLDEDRRTTEVRSERSRSDGRVIETRSVPMLMGDGHVQTLTDVTERRRADERLRESEARYRLLADHTSDLIVLDDASGRHLYISPAVTSMLGYGVEEANRIGLRTLVHREDIASLSATLHALGPERPAGSVIYRMRHRSERDIWVEAAFRRIEDRGEVQIIQALRDVSQRQKQETDLQSARAAAEAAVLAKAEFLANMSHELRTPLAGILGVHDLLRSDASLGRDQTRLVGLAQEAGRSLLTIVNDILDFSKIEAGRLVIESLPFSLNELIEGCRELSVEIAQGRDVHVATDIGPDVPDWVLGDPTRLRQVILNLATNAIKFTPRGSVILRIRWTPAAEALPRRPSTLRIELVDTGIGIAPEVLPQLFERFAQADGSTSRRYGGTGLGLTICKRLVHLMGGEIGAESRVGAGSVFWFVVPLRLAAAQNEADLPRPALLNRPSPVRWRVLLAEDNPINQEIIGTVLRQKGHAVTVVDDGERAVTAAFAQERPELILMDVQMPGQDGLAATQAIRARERQENCSPTPVIALTANAMPEEMERCRAAGMDAHVPKPIEWPVLFATMERLAARGGPDPGVPRTAERPAP